MVRTDAARPWAPRLAHLRPARTHVEGAASDPRPVLLHQGFMIETGHVWRPFAQALVAAGRRVVTLEEHYLRTIDSAHALGHDADLALAQSLAGAIDDGGFEAVDVVAEGTGVGPALLLALNDSRVRRLVLWRPAELGLNSDGVLQPTENAPLEMTDAEVSIGVICTHTEVDTLVPAPAVRLAPAELDIPVLIIDTADSDAAAALRALLPHAVTAASADQHMLEDDLLIARARDFLAVPVAHAHE